MMIFSLIYIPLVCFVFDNAKSYSETKEIAMTSILNTFSFLDNDFENGTLNPWRDYSDDGARWIIEQTTSHIVQNPEDLRSAPPPPVNGVSYLRLVHEY